MTIGGYSSQLSHAFQTLKRRVVRLTTILTLLWIILVCWGERWTFQRSFRECQWQQWELWPSGSIPHHVVLIADPQLVDPHTYPDRPWPLSSLTMFYTDLYLRRSYNHIQDYLDPDSLFFLGDLFDGGREWGAPPTAEKRYKRYGVRFWFKEYRRFVHLFVENWKGGQYSRAAEPRGRKIISSLPGNHDLGFANGISAEVKDRFDAYFGPLNRIDVVGNHTFVSLDTVSLSAMDQPDPITGSSGMGDGTAAMTAHNAIWKPVQEFLDDVKNIKYRALQHEMDYLSGAPEQRYADGSLMALSPNVHSLDAASPATPIPSLYSQHANAFPNIVLTHVPLFRPAGTDCGPFREHGNALAIAAGYQYQNVLTSRISQDIITKLGVEETAQVYSGDDHDYCEVEHGEFTGRIKEITVKSMSWAMGVRQPGFQLLSLWNPIDLSMHKKPIEETSMPKDTIQNHLCLLPDQLTIFIRYAQMVGLTLVVLAVSAARSYPRKHTSQTQPQLSSPLLPQHSHSSTTSRYDQANTTTNKARSSTQPIKPNGYSYSSSTNSTSKPKPPATDPFLPKNDTYSSAFATDSDDWGMPTTKPHKRHKPRPNSRLTIALQEFGRNIWQVAWVVGLFYLWLIWSG